MPTIINGTTGIDTIQDNTVTTSKIVAGAVVEVDIANGAVTPAKLNTQAQYTGFKNRIINGAMVIDQRNAGAAITPSNETVTYITDRFYFLRSSSTSPTLQQSTDAPAGFVNSLLFTNSVTTTTPTYAQIVQNIEGLNVADLGWGTANAQPVTISFRVKSSLTGTFSVALRNSASTRSYVSTYTITAANTWETKTITVVGDTTGTWLINNGVGINLVFRIGGSGGTSTLNSWTATGDVFASGSVNVMGTASATWQITGVQLEVGSTATSFDYRPYGTELQLCQRYYQKAGLAGDSGLAAGMSTTASKGMFSLYYKVTMRATPTFSYGNSLAMTDNVNYNSTVSSVDGYFGNTDTGRISLNGSSVMTQYRPATLANSDVNGFYALSAEI